MKNSFTLLIAALFLINCSSDESLLDQETVIIPQPINTIVLTSMNSSTVNCTTIVDSNGVEARKCFYLFTSIFKSTYSVSKFGSVKFYFTINGVPHVELISNYFYPASDIGGIIVPEKAVIANDETWATTTYSNTSPSTETVSIVLTNVEFIEN
ncbi:hypothetical protein [uncultured Flavobacterium sp.]|uniref:hypothetical protein n=1 Tax=uncultured Flavobacterium sp. TaxID=165435 RepID=UPI0030CA1617|tara:strand:+ start:278 stop:739 length:462 start_codon:yes stop_codon:yes gene_type:complete